MFPKALMFIGSTGVISCGLFGWFLTALYADGPITNGISSLIRDLREGLWIFPAFSFAFWLWGVILKKEASVRVKHVRNFGIGVMLFSLAIILLHSIEMYKRKTSDRDRELDRLRSYEECLSVSYEQAKIQIGGLDITESQWNHFIKEDCRQKWSK